MKKIVILFCLVLFLSGCGKQQITQNELGWDVITYNQFSQKQNDKEKFVIVIGDNGNNGKIIYPLLQDVLKEYPLKVSYYYMDKKEDNIGDKTSEIIYPRVIYVNQDEIIEFKGIQNISLNDEDKKQDIKDMFEQWLANNQLSDACLKFCD